MSTVRSTLSFSDTAAAHAKVTSSKTVAKALKELAIADPDTSRAAKKLRKHLQVDAVIYGKLERDGKKKKLTISVYTRGKKPERFEIEYKKSSSKAFREDLREELTNRLAPDENARTMHRPSSDDDANMRVHKHVHDPKADAWTATSSPNRRCSWTPASGASIARSRMRRTPARLRLRASVPGRTRSRSKARSTRAPSIRWKESVQRLSVLGSVNRALGAVNRDSRDGAEGPNRRKRASRSA